MEKTINGKPLKEILMAIREPRDYDDRLQNKYPYYYYSTYFKLADEVVGLDHYSFECIDKQYLKIESGQEAISVCCRLTLLDDNYNPICYRDGWGTVELAYSDKGTRGALKNDANNALKAAFKACWDAFGAFEKAIKDKDEGEERPKNKGYQYSQSASGDKQITVATIGKPVIEREDAQTKKPVYTIKVRLIEDDAVTGKEGTLIFYPNQYLRQIDKFNKTIAVIEQRSASLKIMAKEKEKDGAFSFIFKGFQ